MAGTITIPVPGIVEEPRSRVKEIPVEENVEAPDINTSCSMRARNFFTPWNYHCNKFYQNPACNQERMENCWYCRKERKDAEKRYSD
jgi:hypothetical protein